MPHLVILYTGNLDRPAAEGGSDMGALCRALADVMCAQRDEAGKPVFPLGGVRVLAYPAAHCAVADGSGDFGFAYLNLRMGRGRSDATKKRAGDAVLTAAKAWLEPIFENRHIGLTVQVDEGPEVYDAKHSTLHPLFK